MITQRELVYLAASFTVLVILYLLFKFPVRVRDEKSEKAPWGVKILPLLLFLFAFLNRYLKFVVYGHPRALNFDYNLHYEWSWQIYNGQPFAYSPQDYYYPPLAHMLLAIILFQFSPDHQFHPWYMEPYASIDRWKMQTFATFFDALQVIPIFLLTKKLTKSDFAASVAAMFVTFAGFHMVWGPLPNLVGTTLMSFAFYLLVDAIKSSTPSLKRSFLVIFSIAGSLISHHITFLITFLIVSTILFLLYSLKKTGKIKKDEGKMLWEISISIFFGIAFSILLFWGHIIWGIGSYRNYPEEFLYFGSVSIFNAPSILEGLTYYIREFGLFFFLSFIGIAYLLYKHDKSVIVLGTWFLIPFTIVQIDVFLWGMLYHLSLENAWMPMIPMAFCRIVRLIQYPMAVLSAIILTKCGFTKKRPYGLILIILSMIPYLIGYSPID